VCDNDDRPSVIKRQSILSSIMPVNEMMMIIVNVVFKGERLCVTNATRIKSCPQMTIEFNQTIQIVHTHLYHI
jgi:hypothetical protein